MGSVRPVGRLPILPQLFGTFHRPNPMYLPPPDMALDGSN